MQSRVCPVLLPICNGRFSDAKNQGNLGLVESQLKPPLFDMISPGFENLWDFRGFGGFETDATERQRNPVRVATLVTLVRIAPATQLRFRDMAEKSRGLCWTGSTFMLRCRLLAMESLQPRGQANRRHPSGPES